MLGGCKSALHLRLYRLYLTVIHSNLLKFRPCHGLHFSRSVYTLTQLPDNNTGAGFSSAFSFACRSLPAVTVIQMGIPFLPVPLDSAPYFSTIILGVLTFATMCAGTTMERQELNLRFICMEKSALLLRPIYAIIRCAFIFSLRGLCHQSAHFYLFRPLCSR